MSYLRMAKRHVCIPDADDNETLIEATQLILDVMPSRYNDCFLWNKG